MRMYGTVIAVSMKKFSKFEVDQKTGVVSSDPTYILQVSATDLDNLQALYQCTFDEGFGIENLKAACNAKAPEAERDAIASGVEAAAKQMENQRFEFLVKRAKANKGGFLSLQIGSVQPLQAAQSA